MYKILKDINTQINCTSVFTDEIDDNDKTFLFSFPEYFEDNSVIEKIGVLEPILFFFNDESFSIIDGIKRYNALKLSKKEFTCGLFIIKGWWKKSDLFFYNILKNKMYRKINLIEKANIVRKIYFDSPFSSFRKKSEFLRLIDLEHNRKILKSFNELCEIYDGAKHFIVKRDLPLSSAHLFTTFEGKEQKLISDLLSEYNFSKNKARILLETVHDLKKRLDIGIEDIFKKAKYEEITKDSKLTRDQKIEKLESELSSLRHPRRRMAQKKMDRKIKSLQKDKEINISYDPNFETGKININFEVKNPDDFRNKFIQLENLLNSSSFFDLFDYL